MEGNIAILASVPIRTGHLLDVMAQVVNVCNASLADHGFWMEIVGEGENAHFILLQISDPPAR